MLTDTIYVPSMYHNLIHPFIMRAGCITINTVPKIHCKDNIVDDHSVLFDQSDLWIQLQLNYVFSHLHARVPTEIVVHAC